MLLLSAVLGLEHKQAIKLSRLPGGIKNDMSPKVHRSHTSRLFSGANEVCLSFTMHPISLCLHIRA